MANNSAQTIKSFLIGLGFDVDTAGMNRFAGAIAVQTEAVHLLAEGIKESALKVVSFVRNIVDANDDIYFSTVRLQASAANIKAFRYAADQAGGPGFADTLLSQIQNLKVKLEELPGLEGKIQSLGVPTREQNGQLRDRAEIYHDLVHSLQQIVGPQKYAFANLFGIDANTLDLQGDKFDKAFEEQKARSSGVADAAANDANRIGTELRRLQAQVDNLRDRALVALGKAWDSLSQSTKDHIKSLLDIDHWVDVLGPKLKALAHDAIEAVKNEWKNLSPETKQTIKDFLDLTHAVQDLTGWWEKLTKHIDATNWNKVKSLLGGDSAAPSKEDYEKYGLQGPPDDEKTLKDLQGQWDANKDKHLEDTSYWKWFQDFNLWLTNKTSAKLGIRNNNPGALKFGAFARGEGATGKDAEGFAIFANAQAGLNALADNLASYGRGGLDSIKQIVSKWAPEFDKNGKKINNTPEYISFVAKQLGADANAHLNLKDPKILEQLAQGIELFENAQQNPYGAEMYEQAAKHALDGQAKSDVTINQNINTTVTGAGSPAEVGKAVNDGVNKANGLAARALQGRTS